MTTARAQPTGADSEVMILGEEGVLLSIDGKPVGRLPLGHPLSLAPGPHRFQLEAKNHRHESDLLMIPAGRAIELNLTRGTKGTAIAILSLRPRVFLSIRGEALDDSLRQALSRAAQEGVRTEHAVLVSAEAATNANGVQATCGSGLDCLLNSAVQLDAKMILLLSLPAPAPSEKGGARCGISGELFDVSTGQSMAQADAEPSCLASEDQVLAAMVHLCRRLVHAASSVGKGSIVVTTNPIGARVLLNNRLRGITPWQGSSLPGQREVTVELEGYLPVRAPVNVLAGQTVKLPIELVAADQEKAPPMAKSKSPPGSRAALGTRAPRPRLRLALGGVMLGLGAVSAGFGISGLAVANQPVDAFCNCDYGTTAVGAGLFALGLSAMTAGGVLIALPGPIEKQSIPASP